MISSSRPAEDFETFKYSHRTDPYSRHVELDVINPETSSLSFDQVVSLLDLNYATSTPLAKNVLPWVVGAVAEVKKEEYSIQTTGKTKMFNDVKPEHLESHRVHWKKWCAKFEQPGELRASWRAVFIVC